MASNQNYSIIDILGSGGMGCVYRARDAHGHIVALKMMSNKVSCFPEYRQLFHDEATTLMVLNHPNVVHIVGMPYSDDAGNLFLPMEYVEGITLDKYVRQHGGRLNIKETVRILDMVLEAMQYVHQRDRIHRDIKPSNIMIRPDGTVCIIDFGVAKDARVGTDGATVGRIVGTDGYMSPEQANGLHIDSRTDIYSLGCVLYYMLTGKHAVARGKDNHETMLNINRAEMQLPSMAATGISPLLDYVFLKAVDKDMMRRYQTAEQFREAIDTITGRVKPMVTVGKAPDNDIRISHEFVSRHHLIIRGITEPATAGQHRYRIEIEDKSSNGTGVAGRLLHNNTLLFDYNGETSLPTVMLAGRVDCALNWNTALSILRAKGWLSQSTAAHDKDEITIPSAVSGPTVPGEGPNSSPGTSNEDIPLTPNTDPPYAHDVPLTPHTDPPYAHSVPPPYHGAPAVAAPQPAQPQPTQPQPAPSQPAQDSAHSDASLSWWWGIIIALCPIAGWILSVLWSDTRPAQARSAAIIAWWVLAVWILLVAILTLLLAL
ncbi:MAG: protein kinase [Muribaculaceae bacterium]|nr:protein kinase [Muribaculaceae bacterium]